MSNETNSKKQYESKRILKHVSFNTEKEADLLEVETCFELSTWVKEK